MTTLQKRRVVFLWLRTFEYTKKLPSVIIKNMAFQKGNQINKGRTPWNKGKPMSKEAKLKLSESKHGQITWNTGLKIDRVKFPNFGHFKKHSEETKEKVSASKQGI